MARPEPQMQKACDHCGRLFITSQVHPRRYCSIACEEGGAPLPASDPQSPDYHLHLKGNPEDLVGKAVVVTGFKLVDYSPDWARNPEDYAYGTVVSHDDEKEEYVRKDDMYLGKVVDYDGHYTVVGDETDTDGTTTHRIKDMLMVEQIKHDRWWIDG